MSTQNLNSAKNVIITGANSGIGFQTALELGKLNYSVWLGCRNKEKALKAIEELKLRVPEGKFYYEHLDLCDLHSVKEFSQKMNKEIKKLDILINNAGIMGVPRTITKDGFELHMATNYFGHFALTAYLIPLLKKSQQGRIVNVASTDVGSLTIDDLDFKKNSYLPLTAYATSKLANLLFTFELNKRLAMTDIKITCVSAHPGWTNTNLQAHQDAVSNFLMKGVNLFAQTVEKGAIPIVYAATSEDIKGGKFYGPGGLLGGSPSICAPPAAALNEVLSKKLFELSELRTNVQFLL